MKTIFTGIVAVVFVLLLSSILLRRSTVPLTSNGRVIAVAKRPLISPWSDGAQLSVYAGKTNIFSVWEDFWDVPLFIHPFPDGNRFLCIDDDDTSVLVFVVDMAASAKNTVQSSSWPPDDYLRKYMAQRITNLVITTKGTVRLPSYSEVVETSSYLTNLTLRQFKAASFPAGDLGIYRFYWTQKDFLSELSTNRTSAWP